MAEREKQRFAEEMKEEERVQVWYLWCTLIYMHAIHTHN